MEVWWRSISIAEPMSEIRRILFPVENNIKAVDGVPVAPVRYQSTLGLHNWKINTISLPPLQLDKSSLRNTYHHL